MAIVDFQKQRAFAVEVITTLRAAGYTAYWAGGCVRDHLLNATAKDYDVATDARPVDVRRVFGRKRTLPIGAAFGVITVLGPRGAGQVEVATFRQDAQYSDGRHPDRVRYSTPEEDACRRDFTINGMFYDPVESRVIDFVDGQADLAAGLIRAIGEPRTRFEEDKLRLLRAVRFAAALEFRIDPDTWTAIREMAPQILVVSAERIAAEMRRMLHLAHRTRACDLLSDSGLLGAILPELAGPHVEHLEAQSVAPAQQGGDEAWRAVQQALGSLVDPSFPTALAALLHRAGGAELAKSVGRRWRLPSRETTRTAWLLKELEPIGRAETMPWPALQRLLIHDGIKELLALHIAVAGVETAAAQRCRRKLALPPEQLNPPPLLTGVDLIAHGHAPGRSFARLLRQVRDAQLDAMITTRDEALQMVDRLTKSE